MENVTQSTLARRTAPALLIAAVCVLASLNLWLGPGIVQTHAGGDSPFLLQRVFELATNLRAGVFPARWMPDAAYGLGYPFFNFYATLPYYIAALLNLAGFDLLTAIKLTQTVGMFAAAATIWLFARSLLPRSGALLAAIAYTLAPYHLVNLYVRGDSLQEFYAFIWYPLILWAVDRVIQRESVDTHTERARSSSIGKRWGMLILATALAGLVLTHNVSALIFAPFIILYTVARLAQNTDRIHIRQTILSTMRLALAVLLALLITSWFWAPAIGEAGLVQLNNQTTGYFDFSNHFRALNLVQPTIIFDYRVDFALNAFAMALPQVVLLLVGGVFWWLRTRKNATIWLVVALFGLATLMITSLSKPLWDAVPVLPLTQFPWRFLSVQSLFAALLIGGVSQAQWFKLSATFRRIFPASVIVLAVILLGLSLLGLPNQRLDIRSEDVTAQSLQQYEWLSGNIGTTIRAEYLPKTVQPRPVVGPDLLQESRKALVISGVISASMLEQQSPSRQMWRMTVESENATMTLPLLYWPGWSAEVRSITTEGVPSAPREVALTPYVGSGWVQLMLPKGTQLLDLRYTGTPLERFAEGSSLAGLVLFTAIILITLTHSHPSPLRIRSVVSIIGVAFLIIILSGQLMWLSYLPTTPALQTVDYGDRQFVHRSPILFRGAGGDSFELVGANVTPEHLRAGDAFTLTTTWRDGHAPAEVGVEQELPSGGYFAHLFYFGRSVTYGAPDLSHHEVISEALPGPLLLKLIVRDSAGNVYTPTSSNGVALDHQLLTGLEVTASLESLNPTATFPLRIFPNGIRLLYTDWYQPTYNDVCFRATWDTLTPVADALQVAFTLKGADGRPIARADTQPQAGLAPTWSWPSGSPVSDGYCVPTTGRLDPGEPYSFTMRWYRLLDQHPTGEVTLVGFRDQSTVLAPNRPHAVITTHLYTVPDIEHTVSAVFGGTIQLKGYDVLTTTQAIQLTLYWSSIMTHTQDYKMFVHLAPVGNAEPVRQADRFTRNGMYPTGMWLLGEIVTDTVTLDTAGLPAGLYQLAVGWYHPETLERLPAMNPSEPVPDGRYVLTEITR